MFSTKDTNTHTQYCAILSFTVINIEAREVLMDPLMERSSKWTGQTSEEEMDSWQEAGDLRHEMQWSGLDRNQYENSAHLNLPEKDIRFTLFMQRQLFNPFSGRNYI